MFGKLLSSSKLIYPQLFYHLAIIYNVFFFQVSSTHHRLVLELSDMAESEQQTNNENDLENQESEGSGHDMRRSLSNTNSQDAANSIIMRDWILVAAGLERLFFSIYAMAFAIITSVYV